MTQYAPGSAAPDRPPAGPTRRRAMSPASRSAVALLRQQLDIALDHDGSDAEPMLAGLRAMWNAAQTPGSIVMIDSAQKSDPPRAICALIFSVADKSIVRCALSRQRAINLSRLLIEAVGGSP